MIIVFLLIHLPPKSTLFPYTTLFRSLGVRNLSAAAISSRANFLFGRFEAMLQATNVPGLVTGFFLHRDSPRDRKSTRLNSSHSSISYAVFCLKKKTKVSKGNAELAQA